VSRALRGTSGISSCTTDAAPVAAAVAPVIVAVVAAAVACPDCACRREADFVGGEGDCATLGGGDAVVAGGATVPGATAAACRAAYWDALAAVSGDVPGVATACCEVSAMSLVTDGAEPACPRKNRVPPQISTIPARTVTAIGTYDRSLACSGGGANTSHSFGGVWLCGVGVDIGWVTDDVSSRADAPENCVGTACVAAALVAEDCAGAACVAAALVVAACAGDTCADVAHIDGVSASATADGETSEASSRVGALRAG
jgi:hypothetical protein